MVSDARNRLRSMGGIMASSPELMQAAGFPASGAVAPVVPSVMGTPQSPGMPPEGLNFAEWLELSRREREDLGYPVSIVGGQIHFPDQGTRALPDAAQEEADVTPAEVLRLAQAEQLRGALGYPASGLAREAKEAAARRLDAEAPAAAALAERDTRARAQKELQRVMPGGMRIGEEDPDRVAEAKAEEDRAARAAAQQRLQDTAPEDLLTLGGKLAPPPADDDNTPGAKRTLRERYEQRLELFKDIFGESDEARARDRAMSLAMLGLAIASGQSPNALTNIAQGAMVGLQGMSEQEQARRDREQGLRQLALETTIDEQSAAADAEARAAEQEYDRETRLMVEQIRAAGGGGSSTYTPERLRQQVIDSVLGKPLEFPQLQDPDGTINPSLLNAYADAVVTRAATTGSAPTVEQRIEELRSEGRSDEEIAAGLRANNLDPADYGL